MNGLEWKNFALVAAVAALAGGAAGYVVGRTVALSAVMETLREEGVSTRSLRLVDETGAKRMAVEIPPEGVRKIGGLDPYPLVILYDGRDGVAAEVQVSPGAMKRAAGF
jgi:hypothetical protein